MKRFLSLSIVLVLLVGFAGSSLEAAARKPGLLASLNPFRIKTAEEIDAAEQKADKKRYKKHHNVRFFERNIPYRTAYSAYASSKIHLKHVRGFGDEVTCAMLRAHLATIAAYRAAIIALPEADRPIANHRYRKLLIDNAKTVQALAEREPIEAAEAAARAHRSAAARTKAHTDALELLGFDRTESPDASEIKAHHARLYREHRDNTTMLQALNAAKAFLSPAADGANDVDDDWVASAVDGKK